MEHFLVHNPAAGRGRAAAIVSQVRKRLAVNGVRLGEYVTTGSDDSARLRTTTPEDATLIALGGDGTVQAVAAACVGSDRTLGILPGGSGDDFAHALGIDRHDLASAVATVLAGRVKLVDTGRANGHLFVNAAGTGFDAEVALAAIGAPYPLRERSAYLYAIVRSLSTLASAQARIVLDGEVVHDRPALLVSAQNGVRSGGSFRLAPEAQIADGLLDVVIAGSFSRLGTMGILPRVMAGTHLGHPLVQVVRGRSLSIEWAVPRPAHLEGELLPPAARFDIELQPRSLRVLAP